MHHLGEKTKINLDFGRFCIIFVLESGEDIGTIAEKSGLTHNSPVTDPRQTHEMCAIL